MAALEPGTMAPRFALKSVESGEDVSVTFQELTLLAFYKVTCPTCRLGIPYLDAFLQYTASGVRAVGVVEDGPNEAAEFRNTFGGSLPTLTDPDPYKVSSAYGLTNVPTVFLVEPGGRVARAIVGFDKAAYNELASDVARRLGVPAVVVCTDDDGAPAFKPG